MSIVPVMQRIGVAGSRPMLGTILERAIAVRPYATMQYPV
jgi:hypothetical protein